MLRFDLKRTLLENTFKILERNPEIKSDLSRTSVVNEKEFELLLIVAVAEKAFSSLATALDIRSAELFDFCDRLAPILDLVDTARGELADTHSRYKVITNSTTGLALIIKQMVSKNKYAWLAERFATLVRKLLAIPGYSHLAHSMYMFDAVNFILSQGVTEGEGTGYRPVVRDLYQKLQGTLSDSPDYWLQRAKASLNIEDTEERLLDGIQFATKSFSEAERRRTSDNAEFLIALLYGKLCSVTKFKKVKYITSAIEWFAQAIRNFNRNSNYVQTMLERGRNRRSSFDQLCDFLQRQPPLEVLPYKNEVDYLLSVRRVWLSERRG